MKNSERGKFEDAWQQAFENAEQAPSEEAWAGVEQGLNNAETITMKRRVVFYQRLAAASILFALMLGGGGAYYIADLKEQSTQNLSQNQSTNLTEGGQLDNSKSLTEERITTEEVIQKTDSKTKVESDEVGNGVTQTTSGSVSVATINVNQERKVDDTQTLDDRNHNNAFVANQDYPSLLSMIPEPSAELSGDVKPVEIVRILPAMPASMMASKKDAKSNESLWASLGASAGNYSPSGSGSSSMAMDMLQSSSGMSNQTATSTASSKGSAFSVGMNLGKKISKRWLLQGGVSYLNQSIGYTSNYGMVGANNTVLASVADFSNKSYTAVIPVSSPYEINSVNEFISLPVQAGYLLMDRKFGLQLNSGVSTDLFMQNTLTDKSGQLAASSSGSGAESPFRTVSWAGLMGTELSYRIATQYRVSLVPGLRYSFNSVLKSNETPTNPLLWDVGFRFRYIFK